MSGNVYFPRNIELESNMYDEMLSRILSFNSSEMRSFLDSLDNTPTFRCSWINYGSRLKSTYPRKFAKKLKAYKLDVSE